jgi:cytidylate kinase
MDHQLSPELMAEELEHLGRHWEEKRKAAAGRTDDLSDAPLLFTVALAREAGTQGTLIAHEVGKRLGWPVYDHELLERIAQDMKVHARLLKNVDERHVGWLLEAFNAISSGFSVSESAFVHRLVKTILALGTSGECVIVGRGSALILPAETTLRVRLIAPLKQRIATVSRQTGVVQVEAKRRLETLDRERNTFARDHFYKNPSDPRHYDLILDSTRYGVSGCAGLIVAALEYLQRQSKPRAAGRRESFFRG